MDSGADLLIDFRESSWDSERPFLQKQVNSSEKESLCLGLNNSFILDCSNAQNSCLDLCLLPQQKQSSPMCETLIDLSFNSVKATESSKSLEKSNLTMDEIKIQNDSPKFAEQILNCEQKLSKEQSNSLPSYHVKNEKNLDSKTGSSSGSSRSGATSSWSPSAIYDDVDLLENEKFDFNVSISPSFRSGDDDVFNSQSSSNNNEACRCTCKKKNPKLSTPQKHFVFPQTLMSEISQESTKLFHSLSPNEKPINSTAEALQLSPLPSEFHRCTSPTEITTCQQKELLHHNLCDYNKQILFHQPSSKSKSSVSLHNNYENSKCNSFIFEIDNESKICILSDENKLVQDQNKSFNKNGCNSVLEIQSMREKELICNRENERENNAKIKENKCNRSIENITSKYPVARIVEQDKEEIKSYVTEDDENKENLNYIHKISNSEKEINSLQYQHRTNNNTSLTNQSQSPLIRRETFTVKPNVNENKPLKEFNTKLARRSNAMESSEMCKQFKNNSDSKIKIANEKHAASISERCAFKSSKKLNKSSNPSPSILPRKETFTLKSSPSVVGKIRQKCKALSLESSHSTPIRSVNTKTLSTSEIEKFTTPKIVSNPRLASQGNTKISITTSGLSNKVTSSKVAMQSNIRALKQPNNSTLLASSLSSQGSSPLIRGSASSNSLSFRSPSQRQSVSSQLSNSPTSSANGSIRNSFSILHKTHEQIKPTNVNDATNKSLQLKKAVPLKATVPLSKMAKTAAVKSSSNTNYGLKTKSQGLNVSLPSEGNDVSIKNTNTPIKQRNSSLSTPKCTSTPTNVRTLSQSVTQNTPASLRKNNLKRLSFVPTPKRASQKRYSEKF